MVPTSPNIGLLIYVLLSFWRVFLGIKRAKFKYSVDGMTHSNQRTLDDRDSLHILPLGIMPLRHRRLLRARMIKNSRMEGVVELFSGADTGSGQIYPQHLDSTYVFEGDDRDDLPIVEKLGVLPSYDVYSLRIELRDLGIEIDDLAHLQLSPAKKNELADYMALFTRPLLKAVYGASVKGRRNVDDILGLLTDPDMEAARANLERISHALHMPVTQIPRFLERYGDIYLSLSYYQHVLDRNMEAMDILLEDLERLRNRRNMMQGHFALQQTCSTIQGALLSIVTQVTNILDVFKSQTVQMWEHISAEKFQETADRITDYHVRLGGALCLVDVKMRTWTAKFPNPEIGSLNQRANFLMSDIKPGLERQAISRKAG